MYDEWWLIAAMQMAMALQYIIDGLKTQHDT